MDQVPTEGPGEGARMSRTAKTIEEFTNRAYPYGFVTAVESESTPPGLSEDIIRLISAKKSEPKFMLDWRLRAYRHWATLERSAAEPRWAQPQVPGDRLPEGRVLLGAEAEGGRQP